MGNSIGILGGMGPMATADLFQKIVSLTDAAGDNGHIRLYIDSNASIPDRTAAILDGGEDPLPAMTDSAKAGGLRGGLYHHALQHRSLFSAPPGGADGAALYQYD